VYVWKIKSEFGKALHQFCDFHFHVSFFPMEGGVVGEEGENDVPLRNNNE